MDIEKFLDWLVELNIQFYKTKSTSDYTPSGVSHFYLRCSPERFTSEEIINIYNNEMDDELHERWRNAIADHRH
jgi:hypothetical protein